MSVEKNTVAFLSFSELVSFVKEVERLIAEGHNYDSPELFDAAMDILGQAKTFVSKLEELDINMDPDTTNIPDLDYLFEGNPVTEYVDARINFAMGDESENNLQRMKDAATRINDMYENDNEEEMECTCGPNEGCTSCPLSTDDFCDEDCEDCDCEVSIYDFVASVDYSATESINTALDMIMESYQEVSEDEMEDEDYNMLRFYLSHLPMNSHLSIEELSDKAVFLAFKTHAAPHKLK